MVIFLISLREGGGVRIYAIANLTFFLIPADPSEMRSQGEMIFLGERDREIYI